MVLKVEKGVLPGFDVVGEKLTLAKIEGGSVDFFWAPVTRSHLVPYLRGKRRCFTKDGNGFVPDGYYPATPVHIRINHTH